MGSGGASGSVVGPPGSRVLSFGNISGGSLRNIMFIFRSSSGLLAVTFLRVIALLGSLTGNFLWRWALILLGSQALCAYLLLALFLGTIGSGAA